MRDATKMHPMNEDSLNSDLALPGSLHLSNRVISRARKRVVVTDKPVNARSVAPNKMVQQRIYFENGQMSTRPPDNK